MGVCCPCCFGWLRVQMWVVIALAVSGGVLLFVFAWIVVRSMRKGVRSPIST